MAVLHLALVAKFNLMATTNQMSLTPLLTSLLCPFMLKVFFSFRPLREALYDTAYGVRLFIFQMGQIAFGPEQEPLINSTPAAAADTGSNTHPSPPPPQGMMRWERALRLVYERLTRTRHPQFAETDEESLLALSVLAL